MTYGRFLFLSKIGNNEIAAIARTVMVPRAATNVLYNERPLLAVDYC